MVEALTALCACPADRTGLSHVSLDLIAELGIEVHDLEGIRLDDAGGALGRR